MSGSKIRERKRVMNDQNTFYLYMYVKLSKNRKWSCK